MATAAAPEVVMPTSSTSLSLKASAFSIASLMSGHQRQQHGHSHRHQYRHHQLHRRTLRRHRRCSSRHQDDDDVISDVTATSPPSRGAGTCSHRLSYRPDFIMGIYIKAAGICTITAGHCILKFFTYIENFSQIKLHLF